MSSKFIKNVYRGKRLGSPFASYGLEIGRKTRCSIKQKSSLNNKYCSNTILSALKNVHLQNGSCKPGFLNAMFPRWETRENFTEGAEKVVLRRKFRNVILLQVQKCKFCFWKTSFVSTKKVILWTRMETFDQTVTIINLTLFAITQYFREYWND